MVVFWEYSVEIGVFLPNFQSRKKVYPVLEMQLPPNVQYQSMWANLSGPAGLIRLTELTGLTGLTSGVHQGVDAGARPLHNEPDLSGQCSYSLLPGGPKKVERNGPRC